MNFIKGPVCRGQIAVDVIRDNFWVFLGGPQIPYPEKAAAFLNEQVPNLEIPAEAGSTAAPIATWIKYSNSQRDYLEAKSKRLGEVFAGSKSRNLNLVWDGDGYNQNAALTVFRHFDNASGLAPALNREFELSHEDVPAAHREALQRLQAVEGMTLSTLPQITYLNVESVSGDNDYYTILRDNAHSNISSMLAEGGTLEPEADTLTVVRNFIGSYPNAYWCVAEKDLPELVAQVAQLSDEASYAALMDRYGVRRTSPEFWQHSDKVMRAHHAADPLTNALLDYNRLENR